jgi:hypothetical protein
MYYKGELVLTHKWVTKVTLVYYYAICRIDVCVINLYFACQ